MGSRAPAPAPVKTMTMVMSYCHDAGSWSLPSTPSEAAAASPACYHPGAAALASSQLTTVMPAHEVRPACCHPGAAALASSQLTTVMPAHEVRPACCHPGTAALASSQLTTVMPAQQKKPRVEVRQVWQCNLQEEVALIESLLPRFRYVAVDTEFPGTVYRPAGPAYLLTAEKRYALLKANVDELDVIQLGLTLFDGDLAAVWEFNFREFDVRRHRHAPESIAMLRGKGVDFDRTRREGVDAAAFGPRLRRWLRAAALGRAGVVTFSGGYDLAYLVKVMFGSGYRLPATAPEFEAVVKALLRRRNLFDVKEMARHCPGDLRGGLDRVAGKLRVPRVVGEAHQASSDSLLTCHTFMKMKQLYFDDDEKLARVAGMLTEINTF